MHLKNIRFTKRMRANDLKEIWNIFRHYNLKHISYFTTLISFRSIQKVVLSETQEYNEYQIVLITIC